MSTKKNEKMGGVRVFEKRHLGLENSNNSGVLVALQKQNATNLNSPLPANIGISGISGIYSIKIGNNRKKGIKGNLSNKKEDKKEYKNNNYKETPLSLLNAPTIHTPPAFQPTPYPYQIQGAIQAEFCNKNLLADEPGLGKTIQALLAARLHQANRVLIICPPALITNWQQETKRSHNHQAQNPPGTILTIHPKNKTTPTLPKTGYIITSDTLTTARPTLTHTLTNWQPQLVIFDEAHRYKNPQAKRTHTALKLAKAANKTICLTGTPIISSPLDVRPLLQILDKTSFFPANFVDYYTRENFFHGRDARPETLPDLHQRLQTHVWVRRTKAEVLKDLPTKTRQTQWVDTDETELAQAFTKLENNLIQWMSANPGKPVSEWAKNGYRLASQARQATGIAKISAATQWATNHIQGTGRPLIIWAIHTSVITGLQRELGKTLPKARCETFYGGTSQADRDQIVTDFQTGKIDILIAQITAAGVGLTLTRAQDALFAETEWTPALVVQAEDRIHRISQTEPVTITTLSAPDTLDPVIQRVLSENIAVLDRLTPGSDHHVSGLGSKTRMGQVLTAYAKTVLENQKERKELANE